MRFKYAEALYFLLTLYFPFLIGGVLIGAIVGFAGKLFGSWLGILENQGQENVFFWGFLAIGSLMGLVASTQSLIAFIRYGRARSRKNR